MNNFGTMVTRRLKKAYGIQTEIHQEWLRLRKSTERELSELERRVCEVSNIETNLKEAIEKIKQMLQDLAKFEQDLITQQTTMESATTEMKALSGNLSHQKELMEHDFWSSRETQEIIEDQLDASASTLTVTNKKARGVLFQEDSGIAIEVLKNIKKTYLITALTRLDREEIEKIKDALYEME